MLPLPKFSAFGLIEYVLFAGGIATGFALFRQPMQQVESLIANLRK